MSEKKFEMEEKIMTVWGTKEDISLAVRTICDGNPTEDEVANMLIGIASLHDNRCHELFILFEQMVRDGSIK